VLLRKQEPRAVWCDFALGFVDIHLAHMIAETSATRLL